ncbi:MAG TPA: lysoplasmalogenase [Chitinophagaceae bacterium]
MKNKNQYLIFFFWVALLADCYLIYTQQESNRIFTKGALMPLLLAYFLTNASTRHHVPSKLLVVAALLLAWAGDLFLLLSGRGGFITGLLLFLVMHLFYIIYFWRIQKLFPQKNPGNLVIPLAAVAIFDVLIMRTVLPLAGNLGTPLMAYMAVISLMFLMACNVLGSKKARSLAPQFFIPGAALFLLSDSILGLNMFLWEDFLIGIAVMLTYGYAQHLMVHGFIRHVKGRT